MVVLLGVPSFPGIPQRHFTLMRLGARPILANFMTADSIACHAGALPMVWPGILATGGHFGIMDWMDFWGSKK